MKLKIQATRDFTVGPYHQISIAKEQVRIISITNFDAEFYTTLDSGKGVFGGCRLSNGWKVLEILSAEI